MDQRHGFAIRRGEFVTGAELVVDGGYTAR